jgi:hypothetical protein
MTQSARATSEPALSCPGLPRGTCNIDPEATISRGDGRSTSARTTQSVAGTSAAGAGKGSR